MLEEKAKHLCGESLRFLATATTLGGANPPMSTPSPGDLSRKAGSFHATPGDNISTTGLLVCIAQVNVSGVNRDARDPDTSNNRSNVGTGGERYLMPPPKSVIPGSLELSVLP